MEPRRSTWPWATGLRWWPPALATAALAVLVWSAAAERTPAATIVAAAIGIGLGVSMLWCRAIRAERCATASADAESTQRRLFEQTSRMARVGGWMLDVRTGALAWTDDTRHIHQVGTEYEPDLERAFAFYPGRAGELVRAAVEQSIATQEPFDLSVPFITAAGRQIWVRALGRADVEAGETARLWGIFQDITDQVESRLFLRVARDEWAASTRVTSSFLASLSHEIRTPVTAILGYCDLLLDALGPGEREVERGYVETIRGNGERLVAVIGDLLALALLESGAAEVVERPTPLVPLLQELVSSAQGACAAKGVGLELRFDTPVPTTLRTDSRRLRKILENVLANAVRFTDAGDIRVVATVERPADGEALLRVDVVDTGVGIAAEHLLRIFEPFQPVDLLASHPEPGTGLGLCIAQRSAELLGGIITAESELGAGSRFTLRITAGPQGELIQPAPISGGGASPDGSTREAPTLAGRSVLLVEDSRDSQRLISHHLRQAGAIVDVARHGGEALEIVLADEEPAPDLILMDMQMPVLDGFEATRRLRDMGVRMPIIALTAHAMDGDRERCVASGCDGYLSKPIERDRLLHACAEHLDAAERRAGANGIAAGERRDRAADRR